MPIHMSTIQNGRKSYLCNLACSISKKKCSRNWKEVTCKNCMRFWRFSK